MIHIVKNARISLRVPHELKKEFKTEAVRRNMSLNDYLVGAGMRELRRSGNNDNVSDLLLIRDFVQERIDDYVDTNPNVVENPSLEEYLQMVYDIQKRKGYVLDGVITRYAKLAGVTRSEFLTALDGTRVTITKD